MIGSFNLHVVIFPFNIAPIAKQFWQHSGEGISPRYAEHCLRVLESNSRSVEFADARGGSGRGGESAGGGDADALSPSAKPRGPPQSNPYYTRTAYRPESQRERREEMNDRASQLEHDMFVEERYGRNLDVRFAGEAKAALRKRIAGVLGDAKEGTATEDGMNLSAGAEAAVVWGSREGGVTENDVYLFPTGMSAIYNAYRAITSAFPGRKTAQFGFPYIDTLKIQEKFGSGVHFFPFANSSDLASLSTILETSQISALFTEFPSNPLLKSPDLKAIRELADRHGFVVVVDETIGNFVNVDAIGWADVVVTSLTKVFSGDSNVMGGSMVLNPTSRHYATLKTHFSERYEDNVWCEDAIFLERNSRRFRHRILQLNETTEYLCDYLKAHPKVQTIHYPKYTDPETYTTYAHPLPTSTPSSIPSYGYGSLFSLILKPEYSVTRFYDALECQKGPSLGTNFTLASPYVILAHYGELDWAESCGVDRWLIRVSVGLEDKEAVRRCFERALEGA
ncbi:hypothetical protein HDV00_007797 [Rhizophlyctis rosea]|nr:hypothetical protein HDV00_007797 [Rhizophlyctis rosea]